MTTPNVYEKQRLKDERQWRLIQTIAVLVIIALFALLMYHVTKSNEAAEQKNTISRLNAEINVYGYLVKDAATLPAVAQACSQSDTSIISVIGKDKIFTAHELRVNCFRSNRQALVVQLSAMPN